MNKEKIVTVILMMSLRIQGYIYEEKVLALQTDPSCTVLGLSDFHDKTHPCTQSQLQKIRNSLAKCNRDNTKVLIEDLSSRGSGGRQACGRFVVNSRGGILGGLAEYCQLEGLPFENVEYRYCRVCSLGPVLNNQYAHVNQFPSATTISVAALIKEIRDIMQEIQQYDDGPALNDYYKKTVHEVLRELDDLKMVESTDMSVGSYLIVYAYPKKKLELLKKLLTFDSCLLDLKLVHAIVHAHKTGTTKNIITLAGGSHISRVAQVLTSKAGYEMVYASPVRYSRPQPVYKSLNSPLLDELPAVRPEPIEVTALGRLKGG